MKMKRVILFSIALLTSKISFGQEVYDPYTDYYSVELGGFASSSGLNIGPTFSIYRHSHKLDAGLGIKVYDIWKDGPGIIGTYLGYKFYPNKRKRDFNLYFGYHNIFSTHNRSKQTPVICNEITDVCIHPDLTILLENVIGIGFDLQLGHKMYLFNDISVGALFHWNTFKDSRTEMEIKSTGLIRLGLGYNIGNRKAN